jgi:putative ABC transport system permease protein
MSCILILLYVRDEVSFDRWIANSDRVVQLHIAYIPPDRPPIRTVRAAGRMMEAIRDFAPEQVESGVRLIQSGVTISKDDYLFNEDITFADSPFLELFDLHFFLHGSAATAFAKPMDMVVTQDIALKYFGRSDVLGESLTVCCLEGNKFDAQITGVLRNLPENTHFNIEFLSYLEPSMFDFAPNMLNTWTSVNTYTYFKLRPGMTAEGLQERIHYWLYNESPISEMFSKGVKASERVHLSLMAVSDIHLYARSAAGSMGDMRPLGDINMVKTFIGIALLILIIASVNFMNLSTARASKRAREVALRKVMGASRLQVAVQFLGEAVSIAVLSLLFALAAVELVLPLYNNAINRDLSLVLVSDIPLLFGLLAMTVLVGLVSGSYPAVYLSKFLPARILQANQAGESSGPGKIRSMLVVFQFTVSIGLAVCTVVIYAQTSFARNMDVGYSFQDKLILTGLDRDGASEQQGAIVNELMVILGVKQVVLSSEAPSQDNENNMEFSLLGQSDNAQSTSLILNIYSTGAGFFEAYDMDLMAGRTFSTAYGRDEIQVIADGDDVIGKASVIINMSAARALGLSSAEEAVGRTLRAKIGRSGTHDLEIIGVSEDVYFRSTKFGIRPSVFLNHPDRFQIATINFETKDIAGLISAVERVWKQLVPMSPVSHEFLNDMVGAQYQEEEDQAKLFAAFSMLAVVIACLGLYGLASFTAERRTLEIGIRKVMGARVRDIVVLLVWQFLLPVIIANIIAWPIAWYVMNGWLEGFSHRVDNSTILLASLATGAGALAIAWLTVASRAVKVSGMNPITALRYG